MWNFDLRRQAAMTELIRVSAHSRSTAVAGAIAGVMREHGYAEVQSIGASAVNQAVKAVAIARGYLEQDGMDLTIVPSFTEVLIDGNERTAIRLAVFKRPLPLASIPVNQVNGVNSMEAVVFE
jgi:stage V sporulation protein S